MAATVALRPRGVTTGEWAGRAARGVRRVPRAHRRQRRRRARRGRARPSRGARRGEADRRGARASRLRFLVGKPGLDGHSNGAEQIAVRARDCGFEVVYQGIRLTAAQIVAAAVEEDVHVIGLSILSGSHMEAVPKVLEGLRAAGVGDVPVVVGGIIPDGDGRRLKEQGVAAVYTPKDFELTDIMRSVVEVVRAANGLDPLTS
jgi:(2R)-ethylmalonyl-CoA mutase